MRSGWKNVVMAAVIMMGSVSFGHAAAKVEKTARHRVQMAILLDTSGSMSGLIDQAKTQLWKIVNEFAVKKGGPELEVALYEYGKSSIPAQEGYLRMIVPFTADLDKLSEELFALGTNGGDEYCGRVIRSAVQGLAWSKTGNDYKVIFIAGNEPFTQGDVDFRKVCPEAIAKGIIVNTIFCGNREEGERTGWLDGAVLAEGKYFSIDQNAAPLQINAPQDKEIARLGTQLNGTYLAYGIEGKTGSARQREQDANALALAPAVLAERAVAKSGASYRNSSWDLVDAVKEKRADVTKLAEDELPAEMKKMTQDERKKYVEKKNEERGKIQAQIARLNGERQKYVEAEMKKLAAQTGKETFDAAVITAIREQAAKQWRKS